ncbi:hypothetical protein PFICI_07085 [Pestalotiopsis fici W106-1]|uniref:DUF6594 domain-containing protein n=1 Tax=Pestalotiopsis fici (strain W106-1 / CGMCC3.15140) TaxID=1229662 RepID=W3X7I6_PESFW|nr:uncharacterized protein PFICI_07085 [Pestalotiopsis fici W106-1]ETS82083.1 hypothetical protein PFICI_07085 [Pestalotiopsis fici W106-1]
MSEPGPKQVPVDITREDFQRKPWKYAGYGAYSGVVSLDDFLILRRFDVLNARVALLLQDKVVELETQLEKLDDFYSRQATQDLDNGTFRGDLQNRSELLEKIAVALKRYNDWLLQQSDLRKLAPAPAHDIKQLQKWHENHQFVAIEKQEFRYLERKDDLVRLVPENKTNVRRLIVKSNYLSTLSIWRKRKEHDSECNDQSIQYYSEKRLNNFASGIIVTVGVIMLITPLWILKYLDSPVSKLVVITVFNSVFLLVMSFLMVAKPFEALGATAAYAAVLMVFMQVGTS